MNRWVKLTVLLTLPFLGVLFGLISMEIFLQVFNFFPYTDRLPPRVFQSDIETGLSFAPNKHAVVSTFEFQEEIRINSLGLRDRLDLSYEQDLPIWVVGDSFTEGRGVALRETYAKLLEKELSVGVLNLGMASIGTKEGTILFERNLKRFTHPPKIAILGFYTGNDFSDNIRSQQGPPLTASSGYAVDRGRTVVVGDQEIRVLSLEGVELSKIKDDVFHPPFRMGWPLFEKSKIYNLAASRLFAFPSFRNWCFQKGYAAPLKSSLPIGLPGFWEEDFSFESSAEGVPTQTLLDRFFEISRRAGAVPLVAIFPSKFELTPGLVREYPFDYDPVFVQPERAVDFLVKFCETRQVARLDMLREFRRLTPQQQSKIYYSADSHWRPYGHRVVASALAKMIKREMLSVLSNRAKQ